MAKSFQKRRVGDVRAGQVLHTFGVGSVIDLPNLSGIVLGLDSWACSEWDPRSRLNAIVEERLLSIVRSHLGPQVEQLVHPPIPDGGNDSTRDMYESKGVPVAPFPRWVRCPRCELLAPLDYGVFKLKTNPYRVDDTRYVHDNCTVTERSGKKRNWGSPTVVPARFVTVCENGHLQDFPWHAYVQHAKPGCRGPLRLQERGVSAEVADLWVRCDGCDAARQMIHAFGKAAEQSLPPCKGCHPHLGYDHESTCTAKIRTMLVGASNMWFPLTIASLWIPPKHVGKLGSLIEEHWNILCEATTRDMMIGFRRVGILRAFDGFSDDAIWAAIQTKRNAAVPEDEDVRKSRVAQLKIEEWDVFSHPDSDRNSRDFRLRPVAAPLGYEDKIEKVVLIERLRVVKALTGFTRIGSPGDYGDLSEVPDLHRAPLARTSPTWVPAAEVRGEGIFIQLREDAVQEWLNQPTNTTRANQLNAAHIEFRRLRGILPHDDKFAVARYALIHSLSHALIRQFSIDCGYSAASIQERIYSASADDGNEAMAGVLLYTAAADSEGTLGGLVALGEPRTLANHLDQALERTRLCASDPLCSEHCAHADGLTLHGAACHACMFVSETSCERGNKYLDRAFLVETMTGNSTPFFPND